MTTYSYYASTPCSRWFVAALAFLSLGLVLGCSGHTTLSAFSFAVFVGALVGITTNSRLEKTTTTRRNQGLAR